MFDALLCLHLKGGNLLGLSSLHACRSLSTGLQHTGEGGFFSKTWRFFSLRSVIYILINLEFRRLHARGCRGEFLRSTGSSKEGRKVSAGIAFIPENQLCCRQMLCLGGAETISGN